MAASSIEQWQILIYGHVQGVYFRASVKKFIQDEQLALRLSASFGGGMGRMRLVCGAASGMFMLAGLEKGSATPHDNEGKMANYAFVQQLAGEFKGQYGSLICAELLGLAPKGSVDPRPAERTPEYYEKRPCSEMIAEAVRIYLRTLNC